MKKILILLIVAFNSILMLATNYYKITSFPIDGADIRDTFLIVAEYAGNTYIWNGQEISGKNYKVWSNYSSDVISGDYAECEVAIVHNKWHDYYKQFSVLCTGYGDRIEKGGYYLAGVKGNNGISFSAGQTNVTISYEATEGIQIATQSGVGIFRFNITPNDPHGFKFYQNATNMLYPTLYVKGQNTRYMQPEEYEDLSDEFSYAQADYYDDQTTNNKTGLYGWDLRLYADDKEDAFPQIYLILTNESNNAIGGTYLSTIANGKPWQVYCTNSSVKSSTYAFVSDRGNETTLYLKYCSLTLTPVSKDARGVYTYLIDLKWIDQNNKHSMVHKELPIIGTITTHISDNKDDTWSEMFFTENGDDTISKTDLSTLQKQEDPFIVIGRTVITNEPIKIYNIVGADVTAQNGELNNGCYIVKSKSRVEKIIIR